MTGRLTSFVLLTMGDRPAEVAQSVASIRADGAHGEPVEVVVVFNGAPVDPALDCDVAVALPENAGIPGGRNEGVRAASGDVIVFLDDDAHLLGESVAAIRRAFDDDARLGVATLRLVDEQGATPRAHNPRVGERGDARSGEVVTFLGGAAAIRRAALDDAGGLWSELWYAHEELDLAWRLHDRGWNVRYLTDVLVYHPSVSVSRHDRGWYLTGRNRVWIARRDLPLAVLLVHVSAWLAMGVLRAPDLRCRRAYVAGWWSGWRGALRGGWSDGVRRRPIRWSTVWRLARLGRPPLI